MTFPSLTRHVNFWSLSVLVSVHADFIHGFRAGTSYREGQRKSEPPPEFFPLRLTPPAAETCLGLLELEFRTDRFFWMTNA